MPKTPIEELLASGSPLQRLMPGFHPREQQGQMASAIERALASRRHLVVEAGTGIGKSLAYLLPAARWAVKEKKKVVIATYTKALQEQILLHDLPVVGDLLEGQGLRLEYSLLMGSENYLCAQRLDEAIQDGPGLLEEPGGREALAKLAGDLGALRSGLRTTLPVQVPPGLWGEINRDPDLCLGKSGPYWNECAYRKDVEAAKKAHVLVINQHLLFAGLPQWLSFDAVVIDEAHNLESVAAQFLGISFTTNRVKKLLDDTASAKSRRGLVNRLKEAPADWKRVVQSQVAQAHDAADELFTDVREKLNLVGGYEAGSEGVSKRVTFPRIVDDGLTTHLLEIDKALTLAATVTAEKTQEKQLTALSKRYRTAVVELAEFLACSKKDRAYWAEMRMFRKTPITELHVAPLDVSQALRENLFDKGYPVVLTSATLTVARSFAHLRERIGLDDADELLLDSPFDYPNQSGFLVAAGVPDPSKDPAGHEEAVARACLELAASVPGGIFLLFASWKLLNGVHRKIAHKLAPRPTYRQGEEIPSRLLAAFKQAGNGVLFGTDTFWQGVDVVGPALSAVVITRLPFAPPDSPIENARGEWFAAQGQDAFHHHMLPSAVIKFRQGFGRLIRSTTDKGVVVVLDPRIQTKPYGAAFLKSIPKARWLGALADVGPFFEGDSAALSTRAVLALVAQYPGRLTPSAAVDLLRGLSEDGGDEESVSLPPQFGALKDADPAVVASAIEAQLDSHRIRLVSGKLFLA